MFTDCCGDHWYVSGTPTLAGVYKFSLSLSDHSPSVSKDFSITVNTQQNSTPTPTPAKKPVIQKPSPTLPTPTLSEVGTPTPTLSILPTGKAGVGATPIPQTPPELPRGFFSNIWHAILSFLFGK